MSVLSNLKTDLAYARDTPLAIRLRLHRLRTRKPSVETDYACFIKATHERSKTGASVVRISSGNEFLMSSAYTEYMLLPAPT